MIYGNLSDAVNNVIGELEHEEPQTSALIIKTGNGYYPIYTPYPETMIPTLKTFGTLVAVFATIR